MQDDQAINQKTTSGPRIQAVDPRILIDGYNLLFQSELVGKGRAPAWLQRARQRLIQYLTTKLSESECKSTQIVFDASRTEDAQRNNVSPAGITITFAVNYPEADDLLEEIIRAHSHPKTLRVVSSDQRIRRKARARKSESIDSESFLTELERRSPMKTSQAPPFPADEIQELTETEVAFWLSEFDRDESAD